MPAPLSRERASVKWRRVAAIRATGYSLLKKGVVEKPLPSSPMDCASTPSYYIHKGGQTDLDRIRVYYIRILTYIQ